MRVAWPSRRTLPPALFFRTFAWSFVYVSLSFSRAPRGGSPENPS